MSEEKMANDENAEQAVAATDTDAAAEAEQVSKIEPITLELEDLTEAGKKKIEESLKRPIADIAYSLTSQETRPGSIVALRFEVARDVFETEKKSLLNDLRKEVVLPGFRKGKAPLNLIQRRMGEDVVRDTLRSLAVNAVRQENIKQTFDLISKPQVIDYVAEAGDAAITFEVQLEVAPKVEAKDYTGIEVEVEKVDVTDAVVDTQVDQMRRKAAVVENAPADHAIVADDVLTVDVEVTDADGERLAHLCRENLTVYDMQGIPEEVASQIPGQQCGAVIEAAVKDKTTNRKGEEIFHTDHYRVTIKEVKTSRLPELDDAFAKDLGDYTDVADLRAKVRTRLEKSEEDRRRSEGLGKLYRQIVERNPIDVPGSMIAQQQYNLIMEDSYQMQRYGLKLEQVVQDVDQYMRDQRASAGEMVRLQMLTGEIAKLENLDVSDADVDAEINRMAEESGRKPLAVRARLEAQNQLDSLREGIARKKIGDFLMEKNTVKLVEPKPAAEAAPEGDNA